MITRSLLMAALAQHEQARRPEWTQISNRLIQALLTPNGWRACRPDTPDHYRGVRHRNGLHLLIDSVRSILTMQLPNDHPMTVMRLPVNNAWSLSGPVTIDQTDCILAWLRAQLALSLDRDRSMLQKTLGSILTGQLLANTPHADPGYYLWEHQYGVFRYRFYPHPPNTILYVVGFPAYGRQIMPPDFCKPLVELWHQTIPRFIVSSQGSSLLEFCNNAYQGIVPHSSHARLSCIVQARRDQERLNVPTHS